MNRIMDEITDEEFIKITKSSLTMAEASRKLNLSFKVFKNRAIKLNCYKPNQAGVGVNRKWNKYKYTINEDYFKTWTPQMAYWLGFIAADGSIVNNRLSIDLKFEDMYVLEQLKNDLEYTGDIKIYEHYDGVSKKFKAAHLNIYRKELVKDLNNLGILPRKTYLNINFLEFVPNEFKSFFICGLFDGDGHITKDVGYIDISGNKLTCEAVFKYLNLLEDDIDYRVFENYVVARIRKKENCYKFYDMYIKSSEHIFTLKRKRDMILYHKNKKFVKNY